MFDVIVGIVIGTVVTTLVPAVATWVRSKL
jgi:hypothetical protein